MFSKTTNFFQRISLLTEIYHIKIYHFLSIFRLRNFGHVTGSPQTWYANTFYLYPCCVQIATFHVEHFFCYKRNKKISAQKKPFFVGFRVPKSLSRDLRPPKLACIMLCKLVMLCSNFSFPHFAVFDLS